LKTILFYDGGCPLCSREVRHYRGLGRAKRLDYIDINGDRVLLDALGVSFLVAQRRLHVLTRNGLLLDGAFAFAAVWRELPYYRHLADALYKLRLLPALDRLYDRFAALRFRHRCPAGACHGRA
jgi:predicted DCC family thiol-disulfide oxidoreductase YuxK